MPRLSKLWEQCCGNRLEELKSWATKSEQAFASKPSGFPLLHTLARVSWERKRQTLKKRKLKMTWQLVELIDSKQTTAVYCLGCSCCCNYRSCDSDESYFLWCSIGLKRRWRREKKDVNNCQDLLTLPHNTCNCGQMEEWEILKRELKQRHGTWRAVRRQSGCLLHDHIFRK